MREKGPNYSQISEVAVYRAGGPCAVARLVGRSPTAVVYWYNRIGRIPLIHVATIARLSGIPKEQLRPDLFETPVAD